MAAAKPMPKPPTPGGHWVINDQGSPQLIHAIGPNKWAPGAAKGHSAPPNPYNDPLHQYSQGDIRRLAKANISKAYSPQFTDLSQQEQGAKNLYAKQQADNQYYQNWLGQQATALQTHADAANAILAGTSSGIRDQLAQAFNGQQQQLVNNANARSGNVVNNAQQTDFSTTLPGAQANDTAKAAVPALKQAEMGNIASHALDATIANNNNALQAHATGELGALNSTLKSIANTRAKLNQAQTGDIAKEIARLNGVEIQKAQFQQTQAALGIKLQQQGLNIASQIGARAATSAAATKNATTNALRAQQDQMNKDRSYQLDVQKFGLDAAKDAYQRQHGLGPYAVPKGSQGKGHPYGLTSTGAAALSPQGQTAVRNRVFAVQEAIKADIRKYHGGVINPTTLSYAWHDLNAGRATGVGRYDYGTQILNAAYNSLIPGGGLTQGDVAALANAGLTNINQYFPVSSASQTGNVGTTVRQSINGALNRILG